MKNLRRWEAIEPCRRGMAVSTHVVRIYQIPYLKVIRKLLMCGNNVKGIAGWAEHSTFHELGVLLE